MSCLGAQVRGFNTRVSCPGTHARGFSTLVSCPGTNVQGFSTLDSGIRTQGLKFSTQSFKFITEGSGCRMQGAGETVQARCWSMLAIKKILNLLSCSRLAWQRCLIHDRDGGRAAQGSRPTDVEPTRNKKAVKATFWPWLSGESP